MQDLNHLFQMRHEDATIPQVNADNTRIVQNIRDIVSKYSYCSIQMKLQVMLCSTSHVKKLGLTDKQETCLARANL